MKLRVLLSGSVALVGSTAGTKVIHLAVIAVATRQLGLEAVGLVFFVEAAASIGLRIVDLGFYDVLVRRSARGQATRRAVGRALWFRATVLAIACVVAGLIFGATWTDHAGIATGFFFVFGLFFLHEIGRAILAGNEMFGRNAGIALASRLIGSTVAILGMFAGYGLAAWLAGMALAESIQLAWVSSVAWRALPDGDVQATERPLIAEGLPFWALTLLSVSVSQGAMIIVGGWLGFVANGVFGVATKAIQGALLAVTALTYAAYPALARDQRKVIDPLHGIVVVLVATVVAGLVLAGAPVLARLLGGADAIETVAVIRWLTLAAFLMSVAQPLDAWIRAKDGERGLVVVAIVEGVAMLGCMIVLVHYYGLMGAVAAVTAGALVRLVGSVVLARVQLRTSAARPSDPPETSLP